MGKKYISYKNSWKSIIWSIFLCKKDKLSPFLKQMTCVDCLLSRGRSSPSNRSKKRSNDRGEPDFNWKKEILHGSLLISDFLCRRHGNFFKKNAFLWKFLEIERFLGKNKEYSYQIHGFSFLFPIIEAFSWKLGWIVFPGVKQKSRVGTFLFVTVPVFWDVVLDRKWRKCLLVCVTAFPEINGLFAARLEIIQRTTSL